jgi:hypothetical protein
MAQLYYLSADDTQPETLAVFGAFAGARSAKASTLFAANQSYAGGSYSRIDYSGTALGGIADPGTAQTAALTSPGTPGQRIAFQVVKLPVGGLTITAPGLTRLLTVADAIVVFAWDTGTSQWLEVKG